MYLGKMYMNFTPLLVLLPLFILRFDSAGWFGRSKMRLTWFLHLFSIISSISPMLYVFFALLFMISITLNALF